MQQDHRSIEPNAGQAIPYEDYSATAATTEEEESEERVMKHQPRPPHHKKEQQRSSRKRSISSSSSDSSRSSSSSSVLSSSDDSGSEDGGDTRVVAPKKKKRKKTTVGSSRHQKQKKGEQQQKSRRVGDTTETDDGSINKLISVALRSQKKQYKNQIIQSVKSDLMNTLRSRIVQHQQRGKKKGGGGDDEEGDDVDATDTGGGGADNGGSADKQYRKRIKQAYKEHEEGYDDAPKFNSKQHKKTIGSILSKLGEVTDIELFRIPHIDKEMGLDTMDIGGDGRDNKLSKKMLSASPEKTIPEAVYAALKDAYSSCMLYKYFFRRIYPYLTVPYISR